VEDHWFGVAVIDIHCEFKKVVSFLYFQNYSDYEERTFDTTAAVEQRTDVSLNGADSDKLVTNEVGVV
jgi:hypothetical protein